MYPIIWHLVEVETMVISPINTNMIVKTFWLDVFIKYSIIVIEAGHNHKMGDCFSISSSLHYKDRIFLPSPDFVPDLLQRPALSFIQSHGFCSLYSTGSQVA